MELTRDITEKAEHIGNSAGAQEGATTKTIERLTSAVPSSTWLWLAGGALVGSLALKLMKKNETANFVGEWVPTILLLGVYNKLVKLMGSERRDVHTT